MQKFDLSLWLQDKSRKVVTRDGKPARIVCTDLKNNYPIIAAIKEDNSELPYYYDINGKCLFYDSKDIFFADEEDLNEFERELEMMMVSFSNENLGSDVRKEMPKHKLHNYAHRLLDLARKEICLTCKEYSRDYQEGLKLGREDVLKDLPKLEKTNAAIDPTIPVMYTYAVTMKTYIEYDGYKACINDLFEKLPKEE